MSEPSAAEAIASASELCVSYGDQVVLDHATLAIHAGDRIGLVGRNGTGKSTFLKIAAGDENPDSGNFTRKRDLVTGYLPQVFDLDEESTALHNVLDGGKHIVELVAKYESAPADSAESAALLEKITHLDGWDLDRRAESLMNHLHAPDGDRVVGTLSGGEKRRVALCRALLAQPEFLILDEPTNHLDTEAIEWLEVFLARYAGTCLFVTHDRYFLDRISTAIVELARGKFTRYTGTYTDFLLARAERQAVEEMEEHKRQRFLKRELAWVRRRPSARRTKSKDRIDRYFETAAQEAPEEEIDVDLIIPPAPKLANRIIELTDVGMEFGDKLLFDGLTMNLEAGDRIGIVGRNGLGKSTLLKVILGMLEPTRGKVEIGKRTDINFVDQDRLLLDDSKSILEEVGDGSEHVQLGEERIGIRAYLRRYLFTDERINARIDTLSGGERSRVLLAKILKKGGNVLVLDEPTNDLDLSTLRLLEEALVAFTGSVLVVSHDRYFLNRVCTGILAFEGGGQVRYQVGNYDYYLEKRPKDVTGEYLVKAAAPAKKTARQRKLTYKETRELEGIEEEIMKAEEEVVDLEAVFAAPDFYEKHGDDWQEIQAKLDAGKKRVPELYARWEELEAIKSGIADTG